MADTLVHPLSLNGSLTHGLHSVDNTLNTHYTPSEFPAIDLQNDSPEIAFETLAQAAQTTGVALISNLSIHPPIQSIQRLFSKLYADPVLAARLNSTYPVRGVFKDACLNPTKPANIDKKVTIDLSVARLQKIKQLDPQLVTGLGQDFEDVLLFYQTVETGIMPLMMQATATIANSDIGTLHREGNTNLRLIDYFESESELTGPRCGEHRDYGTYTIVFQDGSVGGLEFYMDGAEGPDSGKWVTVPKHVEAVVSWGWCGAILSNDRIVAARHRVLRTNPAHARRTTAVVFVAPDLDVVLRPVTGCISGESSGAWSERIMTGEVSVREFKAIMGKKWRRREGNEEGEVVHGEQDKEITALIREN